MVDQLSNVERGRPVFITHQTDGGRIALIQTNSASHTTTIVNLDHVISESDGIERATISAAFTNQTEFLLHDSHITGRGQHGGAILMCIHCPTATRTTITDGVEAPHHGVLEESMVYVAAFVLSLKNFFGFR